MGPQWFKVPSKFLLIYWICWFALVRNMWYFKATKYAPITDNENLANNPYFCLGLLSNQGDLLVPDDYRSIILGCFDTFYPSWYGIPLGELDNCGARQTLYKFYVFRIFGRWMLNHFRDWHSLTDRNVLYVRYRLRRRERISIIIWYNSCHMTWNFYGIPLKVSLRSILSGAPLC